MQKRGPKPKPTRLKILQGSRSDRINGEEPQPIPGRPDAPDDLTSLGKAKWDHLCDVLSRMGVLSLSDADALHLYCVAFERWMLARIEIRKYGLLVDSALGSQKANPAVAIATLSSREMLQILTEFGLTPSSRSGLRFRAGTN